MDILFELDDLIRIAKRENNTKRSYLYVNPIQGKHVPVSPGKALGLFSLLARKLEERYKGEALLVIGFAETATAIGSAVAYEAENVKYYMNTTRETVPGAEYLFFTESHSHATEQRLVKDKLDACLQMADRIVFVEDEVTTGNTIERLIGEICDQYPIYALKFGIISILNSMSELRLAKLGEKGILCDFLYHIPFEYRTNEIEKYDYERLEQAIPKSRSGLNQNLVINDYWNSRVVCSVDEMKQKCECFLASVFRDLVISEEMTEILVVGTEEFMFPAMLMGSKIEQMYPDIQVKFYATTRSPIEVSLNKKYPLHTRFPLYSFYEKERTTYVYNLKKYDAVIVVTDADAQEQSGLYSLQGALESCGNSNITLIEWRKGQNEK